MIYYMLTHWSISFFILGDITKHIIENKEFRDFSITALSIEVEENKTVFTILFNNEAYHSAAVSLAVLDNVLFMLLSGPNASIKVSNQPQPLPLYGLNIMYVWFSFYWNWSLIYPLLSGHIHLKIAIKSSFSTYIS